MPINYLSLEEEEEDTESERKICDMYNTLKIRERKICRAKQRTLCSSTTPSAILLDICWMQYFFITRTLVPNALAHSLRVSSACC